MEPITPILRLPECGFRGDVLIRNVRYSCSASLRTFTRARCAPIRATHSTQEYTMAGNTTDPGRSVANKVAAILMAFADGSVRTLSEIASSAQLPSSTAHRLASELVVWRLLERTEDGGYRVGLPLRIIGKDATESDLLIRAVLAVRARPLLAELTRTTGTDARLGVLQGGDVVYLNESGPNEVAVAPLSPTLPAHATA